MSPALEEGFWRRSRLTNRIPRIATLLHRRKIRRPHERSVYLFHQLVGLLGFDCFLSPRVGQHRVPVLFCFLATGMSHEVDECVVPSGCPLWYPVTHDLQIVFGEQL